MTTVNIKLSANQEPQRQMLKKLMIGGSSSSRSGVPPKPSVSSKGLQPNPDQDTSSVCNKKHLPKKAINDQPSTLSSVSVSSKRADFEQSQVSVNLAEHDSVQIWSNCVENEIEETISVFENQLYGSSTEPASCWNENEVSFNEKLPFASEFSTGDQETQTAQQFKYSLLETRNDVIQHQVTQNRISSDAVFLSQVEESLEDDSLNSLSKTDICGESYLFDLYKTNKEHYLSCLANDDISLQNEPRTETTKPEIKLSTEAINTLWLQIDFNAQRQYSTGALPCNDSMTLHCPETDPALTMIENSNPALGEPIAMTKNSNPAEGKPFAMIEIPNLALEEPVAMIESANSAIQQMVANSSNVMIEFPFTLNKPRHMEIKKQFLAVEVKKKRGRPRKKMEPLALEPDALKCIFFFINLEFS